MLLAHHWLAYVEMLDRDLGRLEDCYAHRRASPRLGRAGRRAVSIDRQYVAELLEFAAISANSLDAVSDRDFVVEHLAALALIAVHLSRLAEELVIWSTVEFGFVEIDDAYAAAAASCPRRRMPTSRSWCAVKERAVGSLVALLVTLKGLPLSYNKDLQEDKEGYFRAVADTLDCLRLTARCCGR